VESRQKINIFFFLFLVSCSHFSFASCDKQQSIDDKLVIITKVKKEMGGIAENIPNSIVLSQIILESGVCGSSRSRRTGNFVGIKGAGKDGSKYSSFASLEGCIRFYLHTLSTHGAYHNFRRFLDTKNGLELTAFLGGYAEDPRYTVKLARNIKSYNLMELDV